MPFIEEIEKHKSLSIVGLEKNTGKTECLNYVLSRLRHGNKQIALTSIGIDGENTDQVKQTHKPEIEIYEGMIFVTPELYYKKRKLVAEIIDVSTQSTCLGKLVTSKVVSTGKAMISGPASNLGLKQLIGQVKRHGVDLMVIDGALSRMSLASPAVTDAMILATGAALSANIPQLVFKTLFVYDLINLEQVDGDIRTKLEDIESGIWAIDDQNNPIDLGIRSVLMVEGLKDKLFMHGNRIFASGAVTDKFFNFLRNQQQIKEIELIIKDFTRVFASPETFYAFIKRGGSVRVLQKTKLVAVTINPVSPDGYRLNSDELRQALQNKLNLPVYDVKKI